MKTPTLLIITAFLMSSCNSQKTCKYEKEYNHVSDSLKASLKHNTAEVIGDQEIIKDFAKLPCSEFQEKYKLSDKDLNISISTARTSISIVEAFKAIENNVKLSEEKSYLSDKEYNDGLTEEQRHEQDSLMKIFINGTPAEKEKARKALRKFPSEYSFNPNTKEPVVKSDNKNIEVETLMEAFDADKSPAR